MHVTFASVWVQIWRTSTGMLAPVPFASRGAGPAVHQSCPCHGSSMSSSCLSYCIRLERNIGFASLLAGRDARSRLASYVIVTLHQAGAL